MAWKKPIGKYPTTWDRVKDDVILRAEFKCEVCNKMPDNCKSDFDPSRHDNYTTRYFRVHHIDRDKGNNSLNNLMYVCKKCHGKIHNMLNRELEND